MKYFDFFKNKEIKVLAIIFIILSLIHIIYASVVGRGLFIDGMWWVPHILNLLDEKGFGFYFADERARMCINFISQLPMNIAYHLGIKDKEILISMFTLPLFLFPFLTTIFNFILAKRSKRYDIVFFSLFLYSFCILPGIMYAVVEAFIATSLLLLLFHYFVADIEYSKKDILAIVLLSLISFSSTELVVPFGIIIFALTVKNYLLPALNQQKQFLKILNNKELLVKFFIGVSQLFAAIVVLYLYLFIFADIKNETILFFTEITSSHPFSVWDVFYREPYIVEILTFIIMVVFCFFKKNKIGLKVILPIFVIYVSLFIFMLIHKEVYFYNYASVPYRVFLYYVFPLMILFLALQEILKKYLSDSILHNFIVLIIICGVCNTFIQLFYSYKTDQLFEEYLKIVYSSKGTFVYPEEKLIKEVYKDEDNLFLIPICPIADFLCLTPDYKIKQMVLPFSADKTSFRKFRFDEYDNYLYVYYTRIKVDSEFWDFSQIKAQYKKNKKKFKKFNIQ